MEIFNDITKYDRMSTSEFYKSFRLFHPSIDSTYIERMPDEISRSLEVLDLEVIRSPGIHAIGVEERWSEVGNTYERKVTFQPHNFFEVNHLDLAESYFSRSQRRSEVKRSLSDQQPFIREQHKEFLKSCKQELLSEVIRRAGNSSYSTTRYTRIFIQCNRTFNRLKTPEVRRAAKFFLNRLFERSLEMVDLLNATVVKEVIREFFTFQLLKEYLVTTREYTPECLDYILGCCYAERFNVKRFLNFENQREEAPFCPISFCILSSPINIQKLKVLLAHGFEPLMFNLNVKQVMYLTVKMFLEMRYNGIDYVAVSRSHIYSVRRIYIVLTFLYLVCCSFNKDKEICIESSKMFFSSIPDPFVSCDEMYRILPSAFDTKRLELTERFDMFKDSYIPVSMPRKLQHLSRCAVRARLRENLRLPVCHDLLEIPICIIPYLNLLEY